MVFNVAAIAAAHAMKETSNVENNTEILNTSDEYHHYYDLVIKKFFRFPVIKVAVGEFPNLVIKTINSQTLWISQHFLFSAEDCQETPANYVKQNLERFSSLRVWEQKEKEALHRYLEKVKSDYNITLDETKLKYTTNFSWVVDRHTKKDRVEVLSSYWS